MTNERRNRTTKRAHHGPRRRSKPELSVRARRRSAKRAIVAMDIAARGWVAIVALVIAVAVVAGAGAAHSRES